MAAMTLFLLVLAGAGAFVAACYAAWSLRSESLGREIHAHSDGTVHTHHRGSRPHAHPTFIERYDARLDRVLGPRAS